MPNVYFKSANGTIFDLREFTGCKLKDADFHKYSWGRATTKKQFGEVIDRFTKDAQLYTAKIIFKGTYNQRKQKVDNFHFETERDIANKTPGRIYFNEDYIECYVIDSDTYPSDDNPLWTVNDVTFYCPYPFWIEEKIIEIKPLDVSIISTDKGYREDDNLGYPYPYSYAVGQNAMHFYLDHYASCDFKLIAYGPFDAMNVNISGNIYNVNYAARDHQYLTVDSRQSTDPDRRCFLTSETGQKTNVFDYRNPNYSLFKKIPPGSNIINFVRDYGLQLTVFMERSEPR